MSRKSRKNVGVIGLGIIGTRVAAGLRAAGYQSYVWNRSAKPAPNFLGSPAEVADAAEIVQIFVADAAALFEVLEAMGPALTAKHIVICSATVGPEAVLEAAQIVEGRGAQFLDAPFTGSKLAAEKRQLVYYIGGAEHTFLKVKPVLEATSKAIVRIGEVGHAATVKVVTNMISAVTAQVLSEALSIVQKAGLEPEVLSAAIEQNACRSGVTDLKLPKMIAGDYDPHFSLKHMFKDVQLGIHMANALDIEVPATTVTAGVMYGAINQGWSDLDFSVLFRNYAAPEPELEGLPALAESTAGAQDFKEEREVSELPATAEQEKAAMENPEEPASGEAAPSTAESSAAPTSAAPDDAAQSTPPVEEALVKQTEPTLASAQIIEALLSHSSGALLAEPMEKSKDANEAQPSEATAASDDQNSALEKEGRPGPEQGDGAESAEGGSKSAPRPNNFVRRWFVARSGS